MPGGHRGSFAASTGPALAVAPFDGLEGAADYALGAGTQQLATSNFTGGRAAPRELVRALTCCTITINDCILPTADPRATIGGVGQSGWGVSRGAAGLLAMTRPVHVAGTSRRFRLPIDTPIPSVASRLVRACLWTYGAGSGRTVV